MQKLSGRTPDAAVEGWSDRFCGQRTVHTVLRTMRVERGGFRQESPQTARQATSGRYGQLAAQIRPGSSLRNPRTD